MFATFMEILDTTVVNVAIPHIAGNLASTVEQGTWVVTSYLVANAIIPPISGWLANYLGRKRLLLSCVAGFTLTSLLCGLAGSLPWLICFRVLQGLTGGGLQPLAQAILIETFPEHGQAMAAYGLGILLAPILGPTLGGWITDNYSWRWIFYLNLPVGVCVSHHVFSLPPQPQRGLLGHFLGASVPRHRSQLFVHPADGPQHVGHRQGKDGPRHQHLQSDA